MPEVNVVKFYDRVEDIGFGLKEVTIDNKKGLLLDNKMVMPLIATEIYDIEKDRYVVFYNENDLCGLYDIKENKLLLEPIYKNIELLEYISEKDYEENNFFEVALEEYENDGVTEYSKISIYNAETEKTILKNGEDYFSLRGQCILKRGKNDYKIFDYNGKLLLEAKEINCTMHEDFKEVILKDKTKNLFNINTKELVFETNNTLGKIEYVDKRFIVYKDKNTQIHDILNNITYTHYDLELKEIVSLENIFFIMKNKKELFSVYQGIDKIFSSIYAYQVLGNLIYIGDSAEQIIDLKTMENLLPENTNVLKIINNQNVILENEYEEFIYNLISKEKIFLNSIKYETLLNRYIKIKTVTGENIYDLETNTLKFANDYRKIHKIFNNPHVEKSLIVQEYDVSYIYDLNKCEIISDTYKEYCQKIYELVIMSNSIYKIDYKEKSAVIEGELSIINGLKGRKIINETFDKIIVLESIPLLILEKNDVITLVSTNSFNVLRNNITSIDYNEKTNEFTLMYGLEKEVISLEELCKEQIQVIEKVELTDSEVGSLEKVDGNYINESDKRKYLTLKNIEKSTKI